LLGDRELAEVLEDFLVVAVAEESLLHRQFTRPGLRKLLVLADPAYFPGVGESLDGAGALMLVESVHDYKIAAVKLNDVRFHLSDLHRLPSRSLPDVKVVLNNPFPKPIPVAHNQCITVVNNARVHSYYARCLLLVIQIYSSLFFPSAFW